VATVGLPNRVFETARLTSLRGTLNLPSLARMKCPICKKPVPDEGPDRPATYPFCSERCKLIDLGRWLDGKYQVPSSSVRTPMPMPTTGRAKTNTASQLAVIPSAARDLGVEHAMRLPGPSLRSG